MVQLTPSEAGCWVTFICKDNWENTEPTYVNCPSALEAIILAYKQGVWRGSPWDSRRAHASDAEPIAAQVFYHSTLFTRPDGSLICGRQTGTQFSSNHNGYKRMAWFVPIGIDLAKPENWRQAERKFI